MKRYGFALLSSLIVLSSASSFAGLEVQGSSSASKTSARKAVKTKTKKTASSKVTVETYPALEEVVLDDEPVVEIGTQPVPVSGPSTVELDAMAKAKAMEERLALLEKRMGSTVPVAAIATPAPAAPVAAVEAPSKTEVVTITSSSAAQAPAAAITKAPSTPARGADRYFPVAQDRRDQIIARLKVIEALIRESGRAYDYRAMTMAQLQTELKSVRASAKPKAAAPAAAPVAPEANPSETPGDVLKIIFSE